MAAVRLGVIGFGRRLRSMLATLRTLEPDARVVALLDPRADALAAEFPSDLAAATVIGYRGTLRFDWYQDELTVHHHHTGRVERHRFEAGPEETGHHGGDTELARDFLRIVASEGVSRTPLEVALTSVAMCLAARDSCREGRFVDVGAPAAVTT
jgi:predicted dehydrogenase